MGGASYADSLAASVDWAVSSGALAVPAFDQPETILGAGSLGAELREQAPDAHTVLASVGGGGLLAGICAACASRAAVLGVEPTGAPTLTRALAAGHPVDSRGWQRGHRLAGPAPGRGTDVRGDPGACTRRSAGH